MDPYPKVKAVGVAGAVITAVVGVAAAFNIVVPDNVSAGALAGVVGIAAVVQYVSGYLKRG